LTQNCKLNGYVSVGKKKNLPQEQNGNGSQHCPHTHQSVNLWALPRTPVANSHFLQHKKKRKEKKPIKKLSQNSQQFFF
jgi:hypothetical protein